MIQYCSYETRTVIEAIEAYGVTVNNDDYFEIEIDVGCFWQTHIVKIIEQVMNGGNVEAKLAKVEVMGWDYFRKPIRSMLTHRGAAHRTELISILSVYAGFYNAITRGFLRADFNMKELAIICVDMPPMIRDLQDLSLAMRASGENRSPYYLGGILKREHQTRRGKAREIQHNNTQGEDRGWQPPPDPDLDIVDRMELALDWQDRLNNAKIAQGLNEL